MADLDARFEMNRLLDTYGPLLTEHRREVVRLYCEEDLSLAEIAQQMSITRQGVSDALNKSRLQMQEMEDKLGFAARDREMQGLIRSCLALLREGAQAKAEEILLSIINER